MKNPHVSNRNRHRRREEQDGTDKHHPSNRDEVNGSPPSSQGERPLDEPNLVPVELVREDNRDIGEV